MKERFERLKAEVDPDLILTHRLEDRHQDHRLVAELTWNTFRGHLVLEYEIPKYEGDLGQPNLFVPLEPERCQRKIELLRKCFPSQAGRSWFSDDTFWALLRLRGSSPAGRAASPRRSGPQARPSDAAAAPPPATAQHGAGRGRAGRSDLPSVRVPADRRARPGRRRGGVRRRRRRAPGGGLRLVREGRGPGLVISDGGLPGSRNARVYRERPSDLRLCYLSPDPATAGARHFAELAEREGWESLVLVTSTYHVRRAGLLLDRGYDAQVRRVATPLFNDHRRETARQLAGEWRPSAPPSPSRSC